MAKKEKTSLKDTIDKYMVLILIAVLLSFIFQAAYAITFYTLKNDTYNATHALLAMLLVVGILSTIIVCIYAYRLFTHKKT